MNHSIRNQLEKESWRSHRHFSMRRASRLRPPSQLKPQGDLQKSLRWQDRTLLIIGIVILSLVLLRIETAEANTRAISEEWGLELTAGNLRSMQIAINTDIKVEVTGLIARAEVTQVFKNPGEHWAQGVYRFPLPDGAAIDRMRIQVGDRLIEGVIQEREAAKRVYQQALTNGFTASLLKQQRPNQFETRLANIGPGEEIKVSIGFLINVKFEDGSFSLRLPTTFTPRWGSSTSELAMVPASTRNDHRFNLEFLINTGIGFAAIESRYHDVEIEPISSGYRIKLVDDFELSNRDFELAWFPDLQAVPQASLMTWDGGDAVYAQLMVIPPLPGAINHQPRELVFIIDTSGSMQGESMQQARSALIQGLDELTATDRFNLVQFNSETQILFSESVPPTEENLDFAKHYIEGLIANGGTVMAPALHRAFSLQPQFGLMRQVIFITDGSVNNEQELLAGIADELGASRLFTVSIGSAPNSWFMRKAAEIGRGSHTHIGKLDEVEIRMSRLWSHIRLPALSDICVDWGTDAEYYPEIIPDLYAGQPLWVVAKLPLNPGRITVCGLLNGLPWEQYSNPFTLQGTDTLATLWARKKIESLEERILFGEDRHATNAQITQVALNYGLLTSQTSLVAVDNTPARGPDETMAVGNIPSLLPVGSGQVIGFAQTATGWKMQGLLSLLTLLISGWMYWAAGSRLPQSRQPQSCQPLGSSTSAARLPSR